MLVELANCINFSYYNLLFIDWKWLVHLPTDQNHFPISYHVKLGQPESRGQGTVLQELCSLLVYGNAESIFDKIGPSPT